jgi:hypothetical protein
LFSHTARRAASRAWFNAGISNANKMEMMVTTTKVSISVVPRPRERGGRVSRRTIRSPRAQGGIALGFRMA